MHVTFTVAMKRLLLVAPLLAFLSAWSSAHAVDAPGSRDHPLVTRFPGSSLSGYFHSDWERTTFPLSNEVNSDQTLKKAVTVEGAITRMVYLAPVGKAPLEVFRNYREAFAKAGLKIKFACDGDCGQLFFHWRFGAARDAMKWAKDDLQAADNPNSRWNLDDAIAEDGRGFYGTLAQQGREIHVWVYTSIAGYVQTNRAATVIEVAEPKAMQSGQVQVDAAAMAKGLAAEGKITLQGIYFDTGKATLKPESDVQLKEMAKLLTEQPELAVFIVGHTDNQGSFENNLQLSKQRATAVRDALVTRFKSDAARITPYGAANVAPVASNSNEAGRTLNRRVELVIR